MNAVTITKLQKGDSFADAHLVRKQVFIEEQAIPSSLELDGLDEYAVHVVIKEAELPVATGRIRMIDGEAKVERVAVIRTARGKGYGALVITRLETYAREVDASAMVLHSQVSAQPFYETLGYNATSPIYEEAGIPHISMKKQL